MSREYAVLIDQYRVEPVTKNRPIDIAAYALGFFLLFAPFVSVLAVPMAIFSLSYFIFVFIILAVWDLSFALRQKFLLVLRGSIQVYLSFAGYLSKKILAFRRARARWETRFFSSSEAWPKVFLSFSE
jgi:hypothetical protein